MIMTEKRAKQHMCHESASATKPFACKASKCTAWRWCNWDSNEITGIKIDDFVGYCGKMKVPDPSNSYPQLSREKLLKMKNSEINKYLKEQANILNSMEVSDEAPI